MHNSMNHRYTLRTLLALAAAVVGLTLSACNTMEGAGRDIKAGGKALENSASKNK